MTHRWHIFTSGIFFSGEGRESQPKNQFKERNKLWQQKNQIS
jgi:hypothetical protein